MFFDYKKLDEWIYNKYETKKPNLNEEFKYMMNSCKKNNVKVGNIEFNKDVEWPIDVIYPEIKKYDENKKYFSSEEWSDIDKFFNGDYSLGEPVKETPNGLVYASTGRPFNKEVE